MRIVKYTPFEIASPFVFLFQHEHFPELFDCVEEEPGVSVLAAQFVWNCQPRNGVIIRGLRPCKVESKVFSKLLSFFTTIWFLLADVKKEDRLLLYGAAEYLPLLVWIRRKQTYFEVTECPDLFKPRTYPWRYYKSLWKRLNGIFVISGNLKQYFVDYGVSPYKVHVINMIVDPKRFESVQRNPNAEKYIAYCGNVNKDSKDGVRSEELV